MSRKECRVIYRLINTAMDCWPSGESIHSNNPSMKGLFAKMLSASGCSLRGLPMMSSIRSGPSRPVSCWRVVQDIHYADKVPECASSPIAATQLISSYPDHEPKHG